MGELMARVAAGASGEGRSMNAPEGETSAPPDAGEPGRSVGGVQYATWSCAPSTSLLARGRA